MNDQLKHLPTTVAEHAVCHLALPWIVPGNLVLQGDIAHSEVEAKGHIIAHGSAEHCRLQSELGSVFLLYGSMAYTKIKAGMNVYVKHSANSGLAAGQDIVIEKSVVGSVLRAGRNIISESGDAIIAGGRVEAGRLVDVHALGSPNGTETDVVVLDPHGRIRFTTIFPGVRLTIGDTELSIPIAGGAGVATLQDGHIHLEYLEAMAGAT